MYRGRTFAALRREDIETGERSRRVGRLARELELEVGDDTVLVDGMDATLELSAGRR